MKELVKAININGVTKIVFNKTDILRQAGVWKLYGTDGVLREFKNEIDMKRFVYENLPDAIREIKFSNNPNGF
jgi:hypothetical protein